MSGKALTTRIDEELLEKLKAVAYVNPDQSQRAILEKALREYFDEQSEQVEEALKLYRRIHGSAR